MIIREPYGAMVRSGTKTLLLNPGKPNYMNFTLGNNMFVFGGGTGPIICRVNTRKTYATFRDALTDNDIQKILPGIDNLESAVAYFESSSLQQFVAEYGVVCLSIENVALSLK